MAVIHLTCSGCGQPLSLLTDAMIVKMRIRPIDVEPNIVRSDVTEMVGPGFNDSDEGGLQWVCPFPGCNHIERYKPT